MQRSFSQQQPVKKPLAGILKNKKHLFIDLDGTLADSLSSLSTIYFDFLQLHRAKGCEEEFSYLKGMKLKRVVEYLKEKYQLEGSVEQMYEAYKQAIKSHYKVHIYPFDQVKSCLKKAREKGFSLHLCTQSFREIALTFLQKYQLDTYFEDFYCGDDGHGDKTLGSYFTRLANKKGILLTEALLIDDSPEVLQAAFKQGLEGLHFSSQSDKGAYTPLASWEKFLICLCNL